MSLVENLIKKLFGLDIDLSGDDVKKQQPKIDEVILVNSNVSDSLVARVYFSQNMTMLNETEAQAVDESVLSLLYYSAELDEYSQGRHQEVDFERFNSTSQDKWVERTESREL